MDSNSNSFSDQCFIYIDFVTMMYSFFFIINNSIVLALGFGLSGFL